MGLFNFGVAIEANNYETETEDQVWIKNENGQLVLMEEKHYDSN